LAGIGYWRLATDFLDLVEAACGELVENANAWVVIGDESTIEKYRELTKWSDHRIAVPVLFNFLHGVELILKGFISLQGNVPRHHELTRLLADFNTACPDTRLGALIADYTGGLNPASPLGCFFATNGISVDDWYIALKYPESAAGRPYDHVDLKYGATRTLSFWKALGQAAAEIRVAAVELARDLGHV